MTRPVRFRTGRRKLWGRAGVSSVGGTALRVSNALPREDFSRVNQLHAPAVTVDEFASGKEDWELCASKDDHFNALCNQSFDCRDDVFLTLTGRETCLDAVLSVDGVHHTRLQCGARGNLVQALRFESLLVDTATDRA